MQWTMDCVAWMPFWTLVPDDEHNGLNANEFGSSQNRNRDTSGSSRTQRHALREFNNPML